MAYGERRPSGSARWPNAEWWAPLLCDLVGIQRASAQHGLLLSRIDLTQQRPSITACWPNRPELRFDTEAEPGPDALLANLRGGGPADPAPSDHGTVFWDPGPDAPLGPRWAFLLDDLSSHSSAWATRADQPFRLRRLDVHTGAREGSPDGAFTDIAVGRPRHDDVVVVQFPLWAPVELIGITYMLVERLWKTDISRLGEFGDSITGRHTYRDVITGPG